MEAALNLIFCNLELPRIDPKDLSDETLNHIVDRIPSYWPLINRYEGFTLHNGPRQYHRDFTILAYGNGPTEGDPNPYQVHFIHPQFDSNNRHFMAACHLEDGDPEEEEIDRLTILRELEANVRLNENCSRLELELRRLTDPALIPIHRESGGFRGPEPSDDDQDFYRTPGSDAGTDLGAGFAGGSPAAFDNGAVAELTPAAETVVAEDFYDYSGDESKDSENESSDSKDTDNVSENTRYSTEDTDNGADDTDNDTEDTGNDAEDVGNGAEDVGNDSGYTSYGPGIDNEHFENGFGGDFGHASQTDVAESAGTSPGDDIGSESDRYSNGYTRDDDDEGYDGDSESSTGITLETVQTLDISDEETFEKDGSEEETWHDAQETFAEERELGPEDDLPDYESDSEYANYVENAFRRVSHSQSRNELVYELDDESGYEIDEVSDTEYQHAPEFGYQSAEDLPVYVSNDGLPGYETGAYISSDEGYISEHEEEDEEDEDEDEEGSLSEGGEEVTADKTENWTTTQGVSLLSNFTLQLGQPGPSSERIEADDLHLRSVGEIYEGLQRRPNLPSYVTTHSRNHLSLIQKARFHGWSPKLWLGQPDELVKYVRLPDELETERAQYL